MIKIIRYTVVVLMTLMVLLLLWQFSVAIALFLLSLALAAGLRPVINAFTGRNIPKRLALGIVYFFLITGIASSILLISPALLDELQILTDDFVANYDRAKAEWPQRGTVFQQTLAEQLPPSADFYQALMSEQGIPAIAGVFGLAQNFLETLGRIAIIIILSLYWSADQFRFERLGLSLLPEQHHSRALHVWRSMESGVGSYLRSELIQSVLTGLFLWLGFSVLGIRYPALLALWGAIMRLIPWFGALIAVLPALFIGIEISSTVGILATAYTIGILLFLKLVIEPRFFPRNKYSSLLIVLFVIALAETFGFIGVVLAPPLAVAVQILFRHLYPFPEAAVTNDVSEEVIDIRKRLLEMRRRIQNSRKRESMRLLERLQRLLRRTTDYLQEEY
jgi:predicted PurR-regulated permease PerM